ncbi:MAG: SAM-dependent methyltransferase [Treponemataceae bacterium]|nr:MAG: SAM-dependent methyltransferase [Treponemataceae bacterium]
MKQSEKQKKIALSGAIGFENFYASLFGLRWQALKAALEQEPPLCRLDAGGEKPYFLDAASIFCANMLPLAGAKNILDMCAAPGGKMLVLALRMENDALLCANEKSAARKLRLQNTSKNCLPLSVQNRIEIHCADSAKLGSTKNKAQFQKYDAILLDAPCSSERHLLLNDKKYIESWSPARIRTVNREQWALIQSGFALLKNGGFLLYATCALGESENDAIIEKLLAAHPDALCIETPRQNVAIETAIDTAIDTAAILRPEKTPDYGKYTGYIL